MTTVNRTWDKTQTVLLKTSTGQGLSGMKVGDYHRRVSSGADRPPGYRPGYICYRVSYATKPWIHKGVVVRKSEGRVRYVYKPDPNYPGWEEPHAYTATYEFSRSQKGFAVRHRGTRQWFNLGTAHTALPLLSTVTSTFSGNDQIALLGKLREAIAGSDFNAGVTLGESKQTLRLIGDTTRQLFSAYKAVKKGDPISAARLLFGTKLKIKGVKSLPSDTGRPVKRVRLEAKGKKIDLFPGSADNASANWLALQYGWKPLVSDIYNGAVFLDHNLRRPTVHRVRVMQYGRGGPQGIREDLKDPTINLYTSHRNSSSKVIVAYIKNVSVTRLSGLMDPLSVAWELLPFSFVADWFIPIGNYLSARGLESAVSGTFVTTERHVVRRTNEAIVTWSYDVDSLQNGKDFVCTRVKITRTVSTSLSIPLPHIKPLSKVASFAHAANAVALFTQSRFK